MTARKLDRLPIVAALTVAILFVAACTIRLRGSDEQSPSVASVARESVPTAAKLEQCRSVTYDKTDTLLECRRIWAEQRQQFLGQKYGPVADRGNRAPSPSVSTKDQSRLPSESFAAPTPGRD